MEEKGDENSTLNMLNVEK